MAERVMCADCDFAVRINEHGFNCKRYPPRVFGQVALDGSGQAYWDNVLPYVDGDDWCGEARRSPVAVEAGDE